MMMGLTCDPFQSASLAIYGEWAGQEVDAMCSLIKPGDVVLDVGANIGTVTVAFAKRVGTAGHVYAFEPQKSPYYLLCGNIALTSTLYQTTAINAAVGEADGMIDVPLVDISKPFNLGGVRLDDPNYIRAAAYEQVAMIKIDSLGLQRCDLMKIDVETMEAKVLLGATNTIAKYKPVIFAETLADKTNPHEMQNLNKMAYILNAHGYKMFAYQSELYSPNNARFCPDNIFPGTDQILIAWPDNKEAPDWIKNLRPILMNEA